MIAPHEGGSHEDGHNLGATAQRLWFNLCLIAMKFKKIQGALALGTCLSCGLFNQAHAEANAFDLLKYATVGVWAEAPLGLAARLGLAVPLNKETAVVAGQEFGLHGDKQFLGLRAMYAGHGVGWGGIELAHWRTRSHPLLADPQTDYYGVEAQIVIFRAGLMFPSGGDHSPTVTLGTGLSF